MGWKHFRSQSELKKAQSIFNSLAFSSMQPAIPNFAPDRFLSGFRAEQASFLHFRQDHNRFFVVPLAMLIQQTQFPLLPVRVPSHTVFYLRAGTAVLDIGSERVELQAPACLVIPAGQVIAVPEYRAGEGWVCIFSTNFLLEQAPLRLQPDVLSILEHWTYTQWKTSATAAQHINHILQYLFICYQQPSQHRIAAPYLVGLLCEIQEQLVHQNAATTTAAARLTQAFQQLLKDHVQNRYTVREYAALLHISPNYLHKVVKSTTQRSPSQWMDERLLMEAKVLLLRSSWSIGRIAIHLGLEDPAYFSRWFKKHTNWAPSQYRDQVAGIVQ